MINKPSQHIQNEKFTEHMMLRQNNARNVVTTKQESARH